MPSVSPTLTGMIASDVADALPTISVVSAESAERTPQRQGYTAMAVMASKRCDHGGCLPIPRMLDAARPARIHYTMRSRDSELATPSPGQCNRRRYTPKASAPVTRRRQAGRKHGQSAAQSRHHQQSAHLADRRRARKADGIDFAKTVLGPAEMFWRQLRFAEFDISEMSMSELMMIRNRGDDRFIGMPVFTTRRFYHTGILVRRMPRSPVPPISGASASACRNNTDLGAVEPRHPRERVRHRAQGHDLLHGASADAQPCRGDRLRGASGSLGQPIPRRKASAP